MVWFGCFFSTQLQSDLLYKGQYNLNGSIIVIQYDLKNKKTFLKRCEYPGIQLKDIFMGATLNVYARQLKVIDFAD